MMKYLDNRLVICLTALVIGIVIGMIDHQTDTVYLAEQPMANTTETTEVQAVVREGDIDVVPVESTASQPSRQFLGGQKPDDGLQKIDKPKFVFGLGAGLILFLVGALIKLAIIVAIVVVAIVYFRNRTGRNEAGVKKDPVDSLIAAFDHLVDKVEAERDKHDANAERLNESLGRLRDGVVDRVTKRGKQ